MLNVVELGVSIEKTRRLVVCSINQIYVLQMVYYGLWSMVYFHFCIKSNFRVHQFFPPILPIVSRYPLCPSKIPPSIPFGDHSY